MQILQTKMSVPAMLRSSIESLSGLDNVKADNFHRGSSSKVVESAQLSLF